MSSLNVIYRPENYTPRNRRNFAEKLITMIIGWKWLNNTKTCQCHIAKQAECENKVTHRCRARGISGGHVGHVRHVCMLVSKV